MRRHPQGTIAPISNTAKALVLLVFVLFGGTTAHMQNGTVAPVAYPVYVDANGAVCGSCLLYTYAAGTTTPLSTYTDVALLVAHANPIVLNAAGQTSSPVFLSANSYKFVLKTAADVTVRTADNVTATHASVTGVTNTGDLTFQVDSNNDGTNKFTFIDGTSVERFAITEAGNVQLDGSLTVGDATEADKSITFDGNAQDYYACLDDSADELVIGRGLVCGTTPLLQLTTAGAATFTTTGSVNFTAGAIFGGNLAVNGTTATTSSTTFNVFNNVVVTGNLFGESTAITIGAASGYTNFRHSLFINDTSNTNSTLGLTVNQGGADDEIVALKSGDVAHGMTGAAEADTYGLIQKAEASAGGVLFIGLAATGTTRPMNIRGYVTDAADTTHTTAGVGVVTVDARLRSGTSTTAIGANGNLFVVQNNFGTRFIVDAEGDTFQDGTAGTAYSAYDDPMLALAWEHEFHPTSLLGTLQETHGQYGKQHLIDAGIVAPDGPNGERGFVNTTALLRLAVGASWQLGVKIRGLESRQAQLEAENRELRAALAVAHANHARLQALETDVAALRTLLHPPAVRAASLAELR